MSTGPASLTETQALPAPAGDRVAMLYLHRSRLRKREGRWRFRCRWCRYQGQAWTWRKALRAANRHAEAKR